MKFTKIIVGFLCATMFLALLYGFTIGDFSTDGKALVQLTWGIISLIDIYIMFTLFSMWVIYRDGFNAKSISITIMVMVLGAFTATLYVIYALTKSKGDWKVFWLGKIYEKKLES